jgi:hypothetical protein
VALGLLSFGLAWWQLVAPNLSVIVFAQLGVYAYFAAAFVPVLFGTFLADTPTVAAASAAATAVAVHFGLYFTGQHYLPYYAGVAVKNPGISTALGIVAATLVGGVLTSPAVAFRSRRTPRCPRIPTVSEVNGAPAPRPAPPEPARGVVNCELGEGGTRRTGHVSLRRTRITNA